jgi:toxin ParE1/3/4
VSRRKLRISKLAIRDIENVLAYTIRQFGERKQREYQQLIRRALSDIAADPDRLPAKPRVDIHPDARTFHIARPGRPARHFFLFRLAGSEFVDIGRLLHDSMDLRQHLPPGFESRGS